MALDSTIMVLGLDGAALEQGALGVVDGWEKEKK